MSVLIRTYISQVYPHLLIGLFVKWVVVLRVASIIRSVRPTLHPIEHVTRVPTYLQICAKFTDNKDCCCTS